MPVNAFAFARSETHVVAKGAEIGFRFGPATQGVIMVTAEAHHMPGYLILPRGGNDGRLGRGRIDVDGLAGIETSAIDTRTGGTVRVRPLASTRIEQDPGRAFDFARTQRGSFSIRCIDTPAGAIPNPPPNVDPGDWIERFRQAHEREFRAGPNQGLVFAHARRLHSSDPALTGPRFAAARDAAMGDYTGAPWPTYDDLAENCGLGDRWFAAHPALAWPKPFISLTGGLILGRDYKPQFDNPDLDAFEPLQLTTIFDHLTAAGFEWRCYEHSFCFLRLFKENTSERSRARQYLAAPPLGERGFAAELQSRNWMSKPSVTFIDPRIIDVSPANANDDHRPAEVGNGQRFGKEGVDVLQPRCEVWAKTLLLSRYDEHGEFFDHLHAPASEVNSMLDDPITGQPATYRGCRVPASAVSPFVPARSVAHDGYDHASIIRTITARFLAACRRTWASASRRRATSARCSRWRSLARLPRNRLWLPPCASRPRLSPCDLGAGAALPQTERSIASLEIRPP